MEIFFVISGFLITGILLNVEGGDHPFKRYFMRRALRIWPAYYVVLPVACILQMIVARSGWTSSGLGYGVLKSVFFVQNVEHYFGSSGSTLRVGYPEYFNHSWSLAVEEQFYLLVPALLLLCRRGNVDLRRSSASSLIVVSLILVALTTAFRLNDLAASVLLSRADGFIFGGALAIWHSRASSVTHSSTESRLFRMLLPVAFAGTVCIGATYRIIGVGGFDNTTMSLKIFSLGVPVFALFGTALVSLCAIHSGSRALAILRLAPFTYLGKISYSTYLWHVPLLVALGGILGHLNMPDIAKWLLIFVLIIVLSHFSYKMIERPALSLKSRLPYLNG